MNYTKNYHLPQWEESDRIMMEDFNHAMADIEAGIDSAKAEARQTDADLTSQIANVKKTADAAQANAMKLPYVTGSYYGVAVREVVINVGFRPSIVIGFGNQGFTSSLDVIGRVFAGGEIVTSDTITITDTGFRIAPNTGKYPAANVNGVRYEYIAFR